MTIKEMQKLYKKVDKMLYEYNSARIAVNASENYMNPFCLDAVNETLEAGKRLTKATRNLLYIACHVLNLEDLYNEPVQMLIANMCDEETFVRWCIKAEVEYKAQEETETETDE